MATRTDRWRGGLKSLLDEIEVEAAGWGVGRRTARYLFVAPVVACLVIAVMIVAYRPGFDYLTSEDAPIEWLQVLGFLVAAVTAGVAAHRYRGNYRFLAIAFGLFALGNLFIAGEEIAWGQRILGLETPEALESINHQNEITLHNITKGFSVQFLFNMFVLVIGMVGAIVPWVVRRRHLLATSKKLLLVPPLFLTSAFLMAGGYRLGRLLFFFDGRFVVTRYGEITELCLAFAFGAFAYLSMRRARSKESDTRP